MTLFFKNQDEFREWLRTNHKKETELWVGYFKKATGKPSMTWSESVDQALCYGWIDGLRRSIDDERYKIRFTPRKPNSNWSAVNIKKIAVLKKKRLMRKAGLDAWEKRKESKSQVYGYENKPLKLASKYDKELRGNADAWKYFKAAPPGYQKSVIGWIMSAKKDETRLRRLRQLIEHSALSERLPQYDWKKKS